MCVALGGTTADLLRCTALRVLVRGVPECESDGHNVSCGVSSGKTQYK